MKINSVFMRLATKWVGFHRRWQVQKARRFTAETTPELLDAYAAFLDANQSGSPRQPFKGWDLWKILDAVKPKPIVELGSGTTSAVFALWSNKHDASYTAFEHHDGWARITSQCLARARLLTSSSSSVICVPAGGHECGLSAALA
jgi:predicted O-methyltransferase YrrM